MLSGLSSKCQVHAKYLQDKRFYAGKPQLKFPELHSFAIDDSISLQKFNASQDLTVHFHLPMSTAAFEQSNSLKEIIPQPEPSGKDKWICNGSANRYSPMQMYKRAMGDDDGHPFFKQAPHTE